jgi:hypothetical protein
MSKSPGVIASRRFCPLRRLWAFPRFPLSEVDSALCRRRREAKLTQQQYLRAKQALFEDIEDASVVNVTDQVVARAVELLERWRLRSSDSLHVASAAEWSAQLFVSADERQCAAARGYSLQVEELPIG